MQTVERWSIGGRSLKRAFPQEPLPDSCCSKSQPQVGPCLSGSHRRAKTSAAMLGLALSMGASAPLLTDTRGAQAANLPSNALAVSLNQGGVGAASEAVFHTVADGESLWQIALAHDVDVQAVRIANGISSDEVIRAGQVLRIPSKSAVATSAPAVQPLPSDQLVASVPSKNATVSDGGAASDMVAAQPVAKRETAVDQAIADHEFSDAGFQTQTGATDVSAEEDSAGELIAEDELHLASNAASDSITDVAAEVSEAPLAAEPVQPRVNPTEDEQVTVAEGAASQETVSQAETKADSLPQSVARVSGDAVDLTDETSATANSQPSHTLVGYRVQHGDTVWSIAQRLGLDADQLISLNQDVDNPNVLSVGETLLVPTESLPLESAGSRAETAGQSSASVAAAAASEVDQGSLSERLQALRSGDWDREAMYERIRAYRLSAESNAGQEIIADSGTSRAVATLEPAELELAGDTPDSGTSAQDLAVDGQEQPDPHVSNLIADVRAMQRELTADSNQSDQQVAVATPVAAPAETQRQLRSLPTIESEPTESDTAAESLGGVSTNPELLAAAPLAPDAYIPETNVPVGRTVSPGLPILPDSDQFLPDVPNRFDGYTWPAHGVLTSGYGWRWGRMHRGIDIAGPVGTPIFAAGSGTVVTAGWNSGGYGNMVDIRHPDGSMTRYAHNSRLLVRAGQQVRQGQQIAEMGSTGYSTGPHLHFEIHMPNGGGTVNPMAYLPQ